MPKTSIRSEMLARRKQLAIGSCLVWSLRIQESLVRLPEFLSAHRLALYSPVRNEVFTEEIFRAARQMGKSVAFPRVRSEGIEFVEVTDRQVMVPGTFGILEPQSGPPVPVQEIDLIAVPGVAFDLKGHRLGFGKGFYDRLLSAPGRRCTLAGLCFEQQLVAALPAEDHDIRMDLLLTEERTLRFDGASSQAVQENYSYGGGLGL
ncbi:MAG: 5-formyltetrahydrofolate cyclo-ligase [Desulfuromonadales bacterium]|nr:5-formyltetrahydrofolate cyclo-ligase [Desulfuromonadales bacterium]